MLRKTLFKALGAGLAMIAAGFAGQAQAASCGISGNASAQAAVYDPFNPTGLAATTITITMRRLNTSGGGDTRVVNFFLRASPSQGSTLNGTSIVPTAISGSVSQTASASSLGLNIFYNTTQGDPVYAPTSATPSGANRFMKINFTGNNAASDTALVTFAVTLPANLNLTASTQLTFDAFYSCYVQGGQENGVEQTGSFGNAVSFPVTVLSALRASYVGTALEFGEIGTITNVTAPTINTGNSNYVRVQSSGPYNVTLTSANQFRLKHPSGSLAVPAERVAYKLRFLGVDRNNASTPGVGAIAIDQNCLRAGVPASEADDLYIRATLEEGGQGKTPSPNYSDQLTVTVTPLAGSPASPAGAISCPAAAFP